MLVGGGADELGRGTQRLELGRRELPLVDLGRRRRCRIVTGTVTATPSIPYSPSSTTDAGQSSPAPSSAATMRATPRPDVQVDDRPESSAT